MTTNHSSSPWSPPQSPVGAVPSRDELLAFADERAELRFDGTRQDYYVSRWLKVLSSEANGAGFNRAAALLGTVWCFWRKLYALGAIVLIAEILLPVIGTLLLIAVLGIQDSGQAPLRASYWLCFVLIRLTLGARANRLYLHRALLTIRSVQHATADPEIRIQKLRSRGGMTGTGLAVALLLSFLVHSFLSPLVIISG